jgi:hypothetical protein
LEKKKKKSNQQSNQRQRISHSSKKKKKVLRDKSDATGTYVLRGAAGNEVGANENCICDAGFSGEWCHIPLIPLLPSDSRSNALWTLLPMRVPNNGSHDAGLFFVDVVFTLAVSGIVIVRPQFAVPTADTRFVAFAQRDHVPTSRASADVRYGGISDTDRLVVPTAAQWLVWVEPRSAMAPLGAPAAVRICTDSQCMIDPCGSACTATGYCSVTSAQCECALGYANPPLCDRETGAMSLCPDNCSNAGVCEHGFCKCNSGRQGINCSLQDATADTSGVVIGVLAGVFGVGILIAFIVCVVWIHRRRKHRAELQMRTGLGDGGNRKSNTALESDDDGGSESF